MNRSFNIENLIRPSVKLVTPYSSAREEYKSFNNNMIFLDANENPYNNGLNRYPDPQQIKVKECLSELKNIDIDNIFLGNGSDEVLDLLIRSFCEPKKDQIIILPPTYGMYQVLANINNVSSTLVPLDDKFQLQVENILNATTNNTKILFLCSPNNPSGNHFKSKDIELLLNSFNGIVVLDEAYIDFSTQESWLNRLDHFPNLVITQTLSKAFGMAGIRLGVCYASKTIVNILNKIKLPYNVNTLTQQYALQQLQKTEKIKSRIQIIIKQRELLKTALKEISFVKQVFPTETNFILVKVDNATKRYQQLINKGIVVRNRTSQFGCKNCLRFTIGTSRENTVLINTLKTL
ncbi:histidinol-phosphate transaminase [Mangrovimonas spongiae]|uniref:Histidinol-phosphate aminotransferase n=1 Tax=Mangrovimonas spongiae TaxID=2494697 RepID=A0A428JX53_9FLAO|nr:histidinol-phosphate transaminase [Mangrovimonas spongiae]RSK38688.1 histidinol-phosphate transaminase [Mangrovimonas spongiae]